MSLVVGQLQLWTIGFKWANLDPDRLRLRIPTPVRDNFSTLLEAVLQGHLDCSTLRSEKYAGDDPEVAKFHIRHWIEAVYAGVHGQSYSRKLLKHAVIDRGAFQDWCERCSIPFPEFWFPPGWTDYRWPEDDPPPSQKPPSDLIEAAPAASEIEPSTESVPSVAETLLPVAGEDSILKWTAIQKRHAACQVIAEVLWTIESDMTITAMSKHELIRKYGQGEFYVPETIYDWIKVVAPPHIRAKRGRPKKETPSQDE